MHVPVFRKMVISGSLPCQTRILACGWCAGLFILADLRFLSGLDWLWLALAVLIDLASIGAAGAANRNQIPQGYPGALPQEPPKP